ncbi:MAG: tail fiber domain-containing protein [Thermodesulfovibrionales bacterium]
MKKWTLILVTGLLLIGVNLYAADGDLIVNGKVGIGTTSPQAKLQVEGSGFFRGDTGALPSSAGKGVRVMFATNYDAGSIAVYDYINDIGKNLFIPYSNVAIGTEDPGSYKLYVSGSAYASSGWYSSDMKFKQDITPIESALSKVLQINGVSFTWKTKDYAKKEFPEGRHHGVIAQDIEKVLPEVVKTVRLKYKEKEEDVAVVVEEKAVAYNEIIPILIEAIKEQQKEIDELKAGMALLRKSN